ncbi:MAG TPA: hypothetical protein VK095_07895 [Beutenbergiaceae bacterium]|nr:hypothetical protein [Beutenbergiaceae bacterium]
MMVDDYRRHGTCEWINNAPREELYDWHAEEEFTGKADLAIVRLREVCYNWRTSPSQQGS